MIDLIEVVSYIRKNNMRPITEVVSDIARTFGTKDGSNLLAIYLNIGRKDILDWLVGQLVALDVGPKRLTGYLIQISDDVFNVESYGYEKIYPSMAFARSMVKEVYLNTDDDIIVIVVDQTEDDVE